MVSALKGSGKPLFRNTRDEPWKRMTGVVRCLTLKKKLGRDLDPKKSKCSSYTYRHTFVHRMLSSYRNKGIGCSIETLAELIGDTPMAANDHYGKEWGRHYQASLWAAIGVMERKGTIDRGQSLIPTRKSSIDVLSPRLNCNIKFRQRL